MRLVMHLGTWKLSCTRDVEDESQIQVQNVSRGTQEAESHAQDLGTESLEGATTHVLLLDWQRALAGELVASRDLTCFCHTQLTGFFAGVHRHGCLQTPFLKGSALLQGGESSS